MVQIWSRNTRKLRVNKNFELHCLGTAPRAKGPLINPETALKSP